jgi:RimJ/RimL family protein N-acetyltransferase
VTNLPAFRTLTCTLRDGSAVLIRPIRPDDAPHLQLLHSRLSPESIYYRYLDCRRAITPAQAREQAEVDYHTRMALVAVREEAGSEQIIGVARYAQAAGREPGIADVAVVVEDRFQNQGLGTRLLDLLARCALENGIPAFTGTVHCQNGRILRYIRRSGLPVERRLELGIWELRINLLEGALPAQGAD